MFRESIGGSQHVSRVNWFSLGLLKRVSRVICFRTGSSKRVSRVIDSERGFKARFRESFGSERGFNSRFASHLIKTGLQSAFRESFDSKRGFKARFASHLIQNGFSVLNQMTRETRFEARFGFLTVTNLPGTPENSWTRFIYINYYESAPKIEQGTGLNWQINTWSGFSSRVSRHARARLCVYVWCESGSGFCEVSAWFSACVWRWEARDFPRTRRVSRAEPTLFCYSLLL